MIRAALLPIMLTLSIKVLGQDVGPIRCVVTLYDLRGENWKLVKSVEFIPKLGEEELTSKKLRLPNSKLNIFASTFPTDESMHSAKGADSLKLGLATSPNGQGNAFDLANNAVAEVTFATLDTARVEQTVKTARRLMLTRLECWDSQLEKRN